jgi:glycosyltransferase involved in cell wall biosynthesis
MKIAYFIDHLRPDGTQFVLKQLVRGLGARGHEQTVFCLNDSWDDDLLEHLQELGAEVEIIGKKSLFTGVGLWFIWRKLRDNQFDAAITLLFASDVIGRAMSRLAKIPRVITSIQTLDVYYHPWQRWLVRRTAWISDVVILCSSHLQEFAMKEEGIKEEQIEVVFHSIRVDEFSQPHNPMFLRKEYNLPDTTYVLGSVGRLTYQKGFDILLQAIKLLGREDVFLVIAGAGEDREMLEAKVESFGLQSQVKLAGYRRDIPEFLSGLDLYVHPSRYEGMSLAVLQAMASGTPIIATDVEGMSELIVDGKHGWLVPKEDPDTLSSAIKAALASPEVAQRKGKAAQIRAKTQFDEDLMITRWEDILTRKPIQLTSQS